MTLAAVAAVIFPWSKFDSLAFIAASTRDGRWARASRRIPRTPREDSEDPAVYHCSSSLHPEDGRHSPGAFAGCIHFPSTLRARPATFMASFTLSGT